MRQITGLFAILFLSVASAFGQGQVKGKVTDSKDGTPLAGVSVTIQGVQTGTSTGADGSFTINITTNQAILEFSSVGYLPKTVTVTAGTDIAVSIEKDTKSLTDVVVTALGIKREKRSLGYATQTIGGEDVNKMRTGNVLGELGGKVAGLTVINSAGDPGAGTYIVLRGSTSINGNNQPLIVVDGIPLDNGTNNFDPQNAGGVGSGPNSDVLGGVQATNRGLDLNPNDIESITVLKGPEASALYGIQAASGAIIITTKKGGGGAAGKSVVSFNSSMSFEKVGRLPALQNQFAQGDGGVYMGPETGTSVSWGPAIDTLSWNGDPTYKWDKHGAIVGRSDPSALTPVTPYNQYAFFQTGMTADNNIALSGSTANGGYRVSLGNLYQTGVIPKSKYVKTTFSINGNSKLSKKLSVSGGMTYINSINDKVQQGSNSAGLMLGLTRTPATFDNANGFSNAADNPLSYSFPDGSQRSYRGGGGYDNPYWVVNKDPYTSDLDRIFGYGQADLQVLDWLSFTYRLGGDVYAQSDKNAFDIGSNSNGLGGKGAVYLFNYGNRQFNSDFIVNAKHNFSKDFGGSIVIGHNYFTQYGTTRAVVGTSLALPGFLDISNASSVSAVPNLGEVENKYRTQAVYTDIELNYKRMLYLGITGRDEESSTLPASDNTFFYPSVSIGWVFTELKKFKENTKVLDFGKLRFSAAQVGKDAPIYALTTPYSSATFADGFTSGITFPVNGVPGYQLSSGVTVVGNPDLKPEQTNSYEGGVDLGFFKDRISLNATVYYSKSKDVIFQVPLPYTSGFSAKNINGAVIQNSGVELTLNATPVKLDNGLRWDLTVNWSHNASMVESLAPGINNIRIGGFGGGEAEVDVIAGQPYGVLYGNTTLHAIPTNLKSPLIIDDAVADGDNYGQPLPFGPGPLQVIGNTNPKWLGSISSTLTYASFSFGFQIDIRHGGDVWNGTRGALANKGTAEETANRGTPVVFQGLLGHLNTAGDIVHYASDGVTELPGPGAANTIQSSYDENYYQNIQSSFGGGQETDVEDGSYTKLRQISLTYQLPSSFISRAGFTGLSVTVYANNVYTWTKYDGVDPETNISGPVNGQGLDYFNNPSTKSYGIRLNVGL